MNNSRKKEIESPDILFKVAVNRMYSALSSFYMWKWLNHSININKDGLEKAQENIDEVLNKYKNFFHQSISNSFKCFVIDLSIFFDKNYDTSFSLKKLVDSMSNKIDEEAIKKIEEIKKPHGETIALLLELRTKDVAHQAIDTKSQYINYERFEKLFSAINDIMNLLSNKHDNSIHWWNHVEEGMSHDLEWMFENLKRGEKQRIKEIEEEYKN